MSASKVIALLFMPLGLAACIPTPASLETEPVLVETQQGVVTCQLYLAGYTDWDRAIHRPETMDVATADSVCLTEGQRRLAAR